MAMAYRNFIYNEERGFIFAYVPKVACTNWKSVMRYLAGFPDYLDNRLAHDKVNGGLRYLDLSGTDLALLSDRGISKYTFGTSDQRIRLRRDGGLIGLAGARWVFGI